MTDLNIIPFNWKRSSSLAHELAKPIESVLIQLYPLDFANSITLLRSDGTPLEIRSGMHDIAERVEVGVLGFEIVPIPEDSGVLERLPQSFRDGVSLCKLTICESGVIAESGVVLKGSNGEELTIVAGAFPFSLAMTGVLSSPLKFDPEYPLGNYTREPMQD